MQAAVFAAEVLAVVVFALEVRLAVFESAEVELFAVPAVFAAVPAEVEVFEFLLRGRDLGSLSSSISPSPSLRSSPRESRGTGSREKWTPM